MNVFLDSLHSALGLGPVAQDHLLQARQMQALSFTAHISLVCFGIAFPPRNGRVRTPGLHPARAGRLATACLIGGFGFLTGAEAGWAHAIGVTMLLAAIALGLAAAAPRLLEENES